MPMTEISIGYTLVLGENVAAILITLVFNMEKENLELTLSPTDKTDFWSSVSREVNLLRDGTIAGLSRGMNDLTKQPGEIIFSGVTGASLALPLTFLSKRCPALLPVIDLIGTTCAASFASDGLKKIDKIGIAITECWSDPSKELKSRNTISENISPLFLDTAAASFGFAVGAKYMDRLTDKVALSKAFYEERKLQALRNKVAHQDPFEFSLELSK